MFKTPDVRVMEGWAGKSKSGRPPINNADVLDVLARVRPANRRAHGLMRS